MISTGAHALVAANADLVTGGLDIEIDCATTWAGATTALAVTANGLAGTICLDPSAGAHQPDVKLDFALSATPAGGSGGTTFNGGAVDIYTDWNTGSGWAYYGTINASASPISCLTATGVAGLVVTGGNPVLPGASGGTALPACTATLLGMPSDLYLFP
jgi:hypothetical protein